MWGKNIKLDWTCINCGSSVIKLAELKSHEMLHIGKSLSNAIFLRNISIQPASYIVIFRLHFYVLSRRNDLSTLGGKNCNQCDYLFSEVGNLRMHLMKNTVEKSQTIATGAVLHFLNQTIWGHIWLHRGGAHTYVTSDYVFSCAGDLSDTFKTHSGEQSHKCN